MPTDPTAADRERARALLQPYRVYASPAGVETIAQALADERERAVAPFLALADQYARDPIIGCAIASAIRAVAATGGSR